MVAESGEAVFGHGARLGDEYLRPSRVGALAVLDLPKVLQDPAVLRAGASAPSPHLFPPSDGEGTSEMTLNYGGDSNGVTTTNFFLGQQGVDFLHGQWFTIIGQLCMCYLELLRGEVICWKILYGRQSWRHVFLLLCVA